ncbi:hypothetical protein C0J52_22262 [Blattella germanica]|nr:hypothetical protein C0J52_22262 [Blattella germanica]
MFCVFTAFPTENPMIEGVLASYNVGDYVSANCTSGKSRPVAALTWHINGFKVSKKSCSHGSLTALTVSPLLFNMAERQHLRLRVIGLIRAGHSASSAARTIGVPLATAKRWAKLFHENNEVSNRAIPGRPRISTREEDAILVTEAENHPFRSAFELKMASNFPGSPLTARRRLRERGIRSRRTATKEHLKIEHIVDRLAYATIRQDFDWRNVIFSDEVVVSSSNYGPPRVYRIDGHRYDERFVARLYKSGRADSWVWEYRPIPDDVDSLGMVTRTIGLHFQVLSSHSSNNKIEIKCTAEVGPSVRHSFIHASIARSMTSHKLHQERPSNAAGSLVSALNMMFISFTSWNLIRSS